MVGIVIITLLIMILSVQIIELGVGDEDTSTTLVGVSGTIVSFYIIVSILLH